MKWKLHLLFWLWGDEIIHDSFMFVCDSSYSLQTFPGPYEPWMKLWLCTPSPHPPHYLSFFHRHAKISPPAPGPLHMLCPQPGSSSLGIREWRGEKRAKQAEKKKAGGCMWPPTKKWPRVTSIVTNNGGTRARCLGMLPETSFSFIFNFFLVIHPKSFLRKAVISSSRPQKNSTLHL